MTAVHAWNRAARGFSLLELFIAVAVLAILTALAMPSMREFGMRMTVTETNNDLVTALNTARAEAAKRGLPVAVLSFGGSGTWTTGWQVVASTTDPIGNVVAPVLTTPCTSACILTHDAVPATYSVIAKATGSTVDGSVTFDATGALQTDTKFDINVCRPSTSPSDPQSRWITVAQSGQISSQLGTGVPGDAAGSCH